MFSLFKKEKFLCLGINPDADLKYLPSLTGILELHLVIKDKVYTSEDIDKIQNHLNENSKEFKNIRSELNWISESQFKHYKRNSMSVYSIITGVREEFKDSKDHQDYFNKVLSPSIMNGLSDVQIKPKVDDYLRSKYLQKGVKQWLHFDQVMLLDSTWSNIKKGEIFRNIEIQEKVTPQSLEPGPFEAAELLISEMYEKLNKGNRDINLEETGLLKILDSKVIAGTNVELKCLYHLGVTYFRLGLIDRAESYFGKIINLKTDIAKSAIASDFLKPIGELFDEQTTFNKALYWYSKADEFDPKVGLKRRIKELGNKFDNL